MRIQYQLTLRDYLEFNKTYQQQNRSSLIVGVLWVFVGILFILFGLFELINGYIVSAITKFVIGLLFCFGYKFLLRYQGVSLYKKQPHINDVTTLDIVESGLIISKPAIKIEYDWSYFQYFTETENLFLIKDMKVGVTGLLIPKQAFASLEEVDQFREILNRKFANNDR